jgi:hypothetical protein
LFHVKDNDERITVGNGENMRVREVGSLKYHDIILQEVKYLPDLWVNFFTISKALTNGFNLSNQELKLFGCKLKLPAILKE